MRKTKTRHKNIVLAAHSKQKTRVSMRVSKKRARSSAKTMHLKQRPLYKRFALHPLHILFLLCVSVLLVAWTFRATADSYQVTASVPAPSLTQGATITSPIDGQTLTSTPVIVSGQCPQNSYIQLTRNGQF